MDDIRRCFDTKNGLNNKFEKLIVIQNKFYLGGLLWQSILTN